MFKSLTKLTNSMRLARYSTKSLIKPQKPIKTLEYPDFFNIKQLVDLRELFQ